MWNAAYTIPIAVFKVKNFTTSEQHNKTGYTRTTVGGLRKKSALQIFYYLT